MSDVDTLCTLCGFRRGLHGGEANPHRPRACPASGKHPKWPSTIKDETKAGELFDKRLARFWTRRTTSFRPVP